MNLEWWRSMGRPLRVFGESWKCGPIDFLLHLASRMDPGWMMGPSVYFKGMRILDEPWNPYRQLNGWVFCRVFWWKFIFVVIHFLCVLAEQFFCCPFRVVSPFLFPRWFRLETSKLKCAAWAKWWYLSNMLAFECFWNIHESSWIHDCVGSWRKPYK